MVHRQQEHVILGAEPEHVAAHHRPGLEIEGARRLFADGDAGLPVAHGEIAGAEIGDGEIGGDVLVDHLDGPAVAEREGGAQDLVPADDLAEGAGHRGDVEGAGDARRRGHVVERAPRLELIEEPEALLREGRGGARRRAAAW